MKEKKDVILRVLKDICALDDNSDLHKACEYDDINSMESLLCLTPSEVNDLTLNDGTTKINKGFHGLVFALQALHLKRHGNKIINDWSNVTKEEFDDYYGSIDYQHP